MIERAGRTIICSVVFIDIVGYSKTPVSRQLAMKARLNEVLTQAIAAVAESERLILDTGDGAALCFQGDPEDALFVATAVNDAVKADAGDATQVLRTGINLGPIKVVTDLNGQPNAVGDGINVAQRIMSFAGENEILVSRSYYEVVARLSEGNERLFRYLGIKTDKHVREHELYAFGLSDSAPASVAAAPTDPATDPPTDSELGTAAVAASALTAANLAEAERGLARRIGPLAGILVKRAAESAKDPGEFYQTIALAIPDGADRADFLAEYSGHVPPAAAAASEAPPDPPESATSGQAPITAAALAVAQSRLANHIGPLAGVLVRQAADEAQGLQDLYLKLAAHIANPSDRKRFLAAAEADD